MRTLGEVCTCLCNIKLLKINVFFHEVLCQKQVPPILDLSHLKEFYTCCNMVMAVKLVRASFSSLGRNNRPTYFLVLYYTIISVLVRWVDRHTTFDSHVSVHSCIAFAVINGLIVLFSWRWGGIEILVFMCSVWGTRFPRNGYWRKRYFTARNRRLQIRNVFSLSVHRKRVPRP